MKTHSNFLKVLFTKLHFHNNSLISVKVVNDDCIISLSSKGKQQSKKSAKLMQFYQTNQITRVSYYDLLMLIRAF